jgi:hypothetical protein
MDPVSLSTTDSSVAMLHLEGRVGFIPSEMSGLKSALDAFLSTIAPLSVIVERTLHGDPDKDHGTYGVEVIAVGSTGALLDFDKGIQVISEKNNIAPLTMTQVSLHEDLSGLDGISIKMQEMATEIWSSTEPQKFNRVLVTRTAPQLERQNSSGFRLGEVRVNSETTDSAIENDWSNEKKNGKENGSSSMSVTGFINRSPLLRSAIKLSKKMPGTCGQVTSGAFLEIKVHRSNSLDAMEMCQFDIANSNFAKLREAVAPKQKYDVVFMIAVKLEDDKFIELHNYNMDFLCTHSTIYVFSAFHLGFYQQFYEKIEMKVAQFDCQSANDRSEHVSGDEGERTITSGHRESAVVRALLQDGKIQDAAEIHKLEITAKVLLSSDLGPEEKALLVWSQFGQGQSRNS